MFYIHSRVYFEWITIRHCKKYDLNRTG